jgi:hypothetical protein
VSQHEPPGDAILACLELSGFMRAVMRQRLRRPFPDDTEDAITRRFNEELASRPLDGVPAPWPRPIAAYPSAVQ